jgi:hypothetical protein
VKNVQRQTPTSHVPDTESKPREREQIRIEDDFAGSRNTSISKSYPSEERPNQATNNGNAPKEKDHEE